MAQDDPLPHRNDPWLSTIPALIVIAGGAAAGAVHYFAGSPDDPEGWLAATAFSAPFVMAGTLALFGVLRDRPILVAAAGIALWPISLLSFSIILWPLLGAGTLLFVHGRSRMKDVGARDAAVGILVAVGLPVAFLLLLVHQDPVSWETPEGGSGSSSDIITTVEALGSIAIVSVVSTAAVLIPRRDR